MHFMNTFYRQFCFRPGVFVANFEQMPHIVLVFPLLTLNKLMLSGYIVIDYMNFNETISCEMACSEAVTKATLSVKKEGLAFFCWPNVSFFYLGK